MLGFFWFVFIHVGEAVVVVGAAVMRFVWLLFKVLHAAAAAAAAFSVAAPASTAATAYHFVRAMKAKGSLLRAARA